MTITLKRNVLLFVVLLAALGVGGYVVGTGLNGSPTSTAAVFGNTPPAAQPAAPLVVGGATLAPAAPVDAAPRVDLATFKAAYDAAADMLIVDVRSAASFATGHIAGAVNIPEAEVASRMAEMPKDKRIVLYCA